MLSEKSTLQKIRYTDLNNMQQENYNYHKIASRLADYGYTSVRLTDDYHGADFLALHVDGQSILRVQLKGRLSFGKKYIDKKLHIAFREGADVYLYPHDELLTIIREASGPTSSKAWNEGDRSWPYVPKKYRSILDPFRI